MQTAYVPGKGKTIATKTLTGAIEQITTTRVPNVKGVIVQADMGNASGTYVEVGFSDLTTGNGLQLGPGASVPIEIDDVAKIYVIGAAGLKVRAVVVGAGG